MVTRTLICQRPWPTGKNQKLASTLKRLDHFSDCRTGWHNIVFCRHCFIEDFRKTPHPGLDEKDLININRIKKKQND